MSTVAPSPSVTPLVNQDREFSLRCFTSCGVAAHTVVLRRSVLVAAMRSRWRLKDEDCGGKLLHDGSAMPMRQVSDLPSNRSFSFAVLDRKYMNSPRGKSETYRASAWQSHDVSNALNPDDGRGAQ